MSSLPFWGTEPPGYFDRYSSHRALDEGRNRVQHSSYLLQSQAGALSPTDLCARQSLARKLVVPKNHLQSETCRCAPPRLHGSVEQGNLAASTEHEIPH